MNIVLFVEGEEGDGSSGNELWIDITRKGALGGQDRGKNEEEGTDRVVLELDGGEQRDQLAVSRVKEGVR